MCTLAKRLGERGGEIARARRGAGTCSLKSDASLVTETDHAIQAMILDAIAASYPDHAVVAEEQIADPARHADRASARYCWVIDPLDGTRNYVSAMPCFATSIAVLDRGVPVVGVVVEHNLRWTFAAVAGCRTLLGDEPISIAEPAPGDEVLVGVSSSKRRATTDILADWLHKPGLVMRNTGSTAMHLGLVAGGMLSAALCTKCKIWDVAAGALLVTGAGGRVTDLAGDDPFPWPAGADPAKDTPILAAGPDLHKSLIESIIHIHAKGR
jgi:myo-inositol-1(or 4)-monophosphatase